MRPAGRAWLYAALVPFVVTFGCPDEVDNGSLPPTDGGGVGGAAGTTDAGGTAGASSDATTSDATTDAAVDIGTPCTANGDCASGVCIDEVRHTSYIGGYCTILGCAPATGDGCPPGTVCSGGGAVMNTMCFDRCSPSGSCRSGYVCCKANPDAGDVGFCAPSVVPACH